MATTTVTLTDEQMDKLRAMYLEAVEEFATYFNYEPPVISKWFGLVKFKDLSNLPKLKWHKWDYCLDELLLFPCSSQKVVSELYTTACANRDITINCEESAFISLELQEAKND